MCYFRFSQKLTIFYRILFLSAPLLLNDFYMLIIAEDAFYWHFALDLLFYIGLQSLVVYLAWRWKWFTWRSAGLTTEKIWKQTLQGVLLFLAVFLLATLLEILRQFITTHFSWDIPAGGHVTHPPWNAILSILYILYLSVSAGLYEELIYRGLVISQLRLVTSHDSFSIVLSSLIFALIHWSLGITIVTLAFIVGLFWGSIYIKNGRLLPLMIAHFLFDFVTLSDWHLVVWKLVI
jgi:membrane protease YdiL (CAAX protease family)